jgi:hypothetical protein
MTISGVAHHADHYSQFADSAGASAVTSLAGEIALLTLEHQENQKQLEREQLATARENFSAALADEVEALKASADATFRGALFEAGNVCGGERPGYLGR